MTSDQHIERILNYAETMNPGCNSDRERAIQGFLIGAGYALKQALRYGNAEEYPRSDNTLDYAPFAKAVRTAAEQLLGEWLFGYYLNDAVFRCAALFGRVGSAVSSIPMDLTKLPYAKIIMAAAHERMNGVPRTQVCANQLLGFLHGITTFYLDVRPGLPKSAPVG